MSVFLVDLYGRVTRNGRQRQHGSEAHHHHRHASLHGSIPQCDMGWWFCLELPRVIAARGWQASRRSHDQSVVDRNVESRWFARQPLTGIVRSAPALSVKLIESVMVVVRLCRNEATLALRLSQSCDLSAARRDFNVGPRAILRLHHPQLIGHQEACAFSRRMQRKGLARRLARSRRSRGDSPQTPRPTSMWQNRETTECLLLVRVGGRPPVRV